MRKSSQNTKGTVDAKSIRRQNLVALLRRFDTAAAFAKAVGTSAAYVSQILSAKIQAEIGDALARKIEKALDLPHGWMDVLHDDVEKRAEDFTTVPVVPWENLANWREIVTALRNEDALQAQPAPGAAERIKTTVQVGPLTHAYLVTSDSMGAEFPEGSWVVVEPEMQPRGGDYVIVLLPNGVGTFRKLVEDAGTRYLKPLNPAYPTQPLPEGAQIVGVVREMVRRFR